MAERKHYIYPAWVQVEAHTLEEAEALLNEVWDDDLTPTEIAPGVHVGWPGDLAEVIEQDDVKCICPPDLVERGGFTSRCPAHG